MDKRPIGVFDSGVGGLSVLKEIIDKLPNESTVYLGDTARVPYGGRTKETIINYTKEAMDFLINKGVKLIVIACNTASALALEEMTKAYPDTFIMGVVEAGVEEAIERSKNKRIGVIATEATIKSRSYQDKIEARLKDSKVYGKACPLFVPLVEEGLEYTEIARLSTELYLEELKDKDIDTLVLGCTHYPAMEGQIANFLEGVEIVNPASKTASYLKDYLAEKQAFNLGEVERSYYVTDNQEKFQKIASRIVKAKLPDIKLARL